MSNESGKISKKDQPGKKVSDAKGGPTQAGGWNYQVAFAPISWGADGISAYFESRLTVIENYANAGSEANLIGSFP